MPDLASLWKHISEPTVIAAIVTAVLAVVGKWFDSRIKRMRHRLEEKYRDREQLSEDEKDFRETILSQLEEERSLRRKVESDYRELHEENLRLLSRITALELEVAKLNGKF